MYAGLASVIIALVFLYFIAAIFRLWRRTERLDHQVRGCRTGRVAASSAVR